MVAASLAKFSQDCSLDLSFLVKGNRGIGKFTTAEWVAYNLGIHLLEVRRLALTENWTDILAYLGQLL